jgi:arylamine N-acetyltransferase
VDVLLGRGVHIDLDSIVSKMVVAGRGGYCFEHGTLFQAVLEQLGFTITRARGAGSGHRASASIAADSHVPDGGHRG